MRELKIRDLVVAILRVHHSQVFHETMKAITILDLSAMPLEEELILGEWPISDEEFTKKFKQGDRFETIKIIKKIPYRYDFEISDYLVIEGVFLLLGKEEINLRLDP